MTSKEYGPKKIQMEAFKNEDNRNKQPYDKVFVYSNYYL